MLEICSSDSSLRMLRLPSSIVARPFAPAYMLHPAFSGLSLAQSEVDY